MNFETDKKKPLAPKSNAGGTSHSLTFQRKSAFVETMRVLRSPARSCKRQRSKWATTLALFVLQVLVYSGNASKEFPIKQSAEGDVTVAGNHTMINSRNVQIYGDLWLRKIGSGGAHLVNELRSIVNSTTTLEATLKPLI
jgi:hypothetical protein